MRPCTTDCAAPSYAAQSAFGYAEKTALHTAVRHMLRHIRPCRKNCTWPCRHAALHSAMRHSTNSMRPCGTNCIRPCGTSCTCTCGTNRMKPCGHAACAACDPPWPGGRRGGAREGWGGRHEYGQCHQDAQTKLFAMHVGTLTRSPPTDDNSGRRTAARLSEPSYAHMAPSRSR
eukprot:353791-Chlamydomonas_euryale.AAC.2